MDTKKIEELLNINCDTKDGIAMLEGSLLELKVVNKQVKKNKNIITLELLENVLNNICMKYEYKNQGILTHFDKTKNDDGTVNKRFQFYSCAWMNGRHKWAGTVYARTLFELVGKSILLIHKDIIKRRENNEQ